MPNQMTQLLSLAWRRSRTDIFSVVKMYVGMWIFLLVFGTFLSLQYAVNVVPNIPMINQIPEGFWNTTLNGLLLAGEFAFINTICTLTFIAIVVCLFEYALAFTTVCYYYDDGKWETVIQIKRFFRLINADLKSRQITESQIINEDNARLKAAIQKIKNN